MAERTDSIPTHVERSNEVVASPRSEQQPPARVRARRSWYSRPASLASPSSPCLNRGLAPGPVYPCTPLQDTSTEPEAKRPRKSQRFGGPDVMVQSLDAVVEEGRQTRIASESASGQEGVRSHTPDYSPPETSFWEPGSLGDSAPEMEESGARDVALVRFPATPSKIPAEQDGSPTKAARIMSGLLSSPARVHRSPGQMLITKTCRRCWLIGHNISKCKRHHGAHGKDSVVKEKGQSAAEAQGPRTTRTTRFTRVIVGRVAKRSATQKSTTNESELS